MTFRLWHGADAQWHHEAAIKFSHDMLWLTSDGHTESKRLHLINHWVHIRCRQPPSSMISLRNRDAL